MDGPVLAEYHTSTRLVSIPVFRAIDCHFPLQHLCMCIMFQAKDMIREAILVFRVRWLAKPYGCWMLELVNEVARGWVLGLSQLNHYADNN